jgi:hypothetical protein
MSDKPYGIIPNPLRKFLIGIAVLVMIIGVLVGLWAAKSAHAASCCSVTYTVSNHWGLSLWFAGHRDGTSGLSNPNTADITAYKTAVYWIQSQLTSNWSTYPKDNTRFWVYVPAI